MHFKLILSRLKNPSVILSIVSQAIAILTLLKITVDVNLITTITTSVCSMFVLLGIMSDPTTANSGYADDIHYCPICKSDRRFVKVGKKLVCEDCDHIIEL